LWFFPPPPEPPRRFFFFHERIISPNSCRPPRRFTSFVPKHLFFLRPTSLLIFFFLLSVAAFLFPPSGARPRFKAAPLTWCKYWPFPRFFLTLGGSIGEAVAPCPKPFFVRSLPVTFKQKRSLSNFRFDFPTKRVSSHLFPLSASKLLFNDF